MTTCFNSYFGTLASLLVPDFRSISILDFPVYNFIRTFRGFPFTKTYLFSQ